MPSERTRVVLDDILRNIELAERFSRDLTLDQFKSDLQVLYATTRALEIISEASRRLPADLKDPAPPCAVAGHGRCRQCLSACYDIVLAEILWQTVQTGLTALRKAILSELRRISQNH
jgi:uncharacterized protein with HEPN domain